MMGFRCAKNPDRQKWSGPYRTGPGRVGPGRSLKNFIKKILLLKNISFQPLSGFQSLSQKVTVEAVWSGSYRVGPGRVGPVWSLKIWTTKNFYCLETVLFNP